MKRPVAPHGESGVGDVQPFDGRSGRDHVAVADPVRHLRDPVLRHVFPAGPLVEPRLGGRDGPKHAGLGELPIRFGVPGHEVHGLRIGGGVQFPGRDAHDPPGFVVREPLREVVQAARVPVEPATAVSERRQVGFVTGPRAGRIRKGLDTLLAHEPRQGENGLDEGHAVEFAEVDHEALGSGDFERAGFVRRPDEGLGKLHDGVAQVDPGEPALRGEPHFLLEDGPVFRGPGGSVRRRGRFRAGTARLVNHGRGGGLGLRPGERRDDGDGGKDTADDFRQSEDAAPSHVEPRSSTTRSSPSLFPFFRTRSPTAYPVSHPPLESGQTRMALSSHRGMRSQGRSAILLGFDTAAPSAESHE